MLLEFLLILFYYILIIKIYFNNQRIIIKIYILFNTKIYFEKNFSFKILEKKLFT